MIYQRFQKTNLLLSLNCNFDIDVNTIFQITNPQLRYHQCDMKGALENQSKIQN